MNQLIQWRTGKIVVSALLIFFTVSVATASDREDIAADLVASAFLQARQAAHLSKLERIDRNPFREKVCEQDMRFASGLIDTVVYQTSDPSLLPVPAEQLAKAPDNGKTANRFGVGVCELGSSSAGSPKYSVLIATYESRWTSFTRIFWE